MPDKRTIFGTNLKLEFFTIDDLQVKKKVFDVEPGDYLVEDETGRKWLTQVDRYQNGHNGDWEDYFSSVFDTVDSAIEFLLKKAAQEYERKVTRIKENK